MSVRNDPSECPKYVRNVRIASVRNVRKPYRGFGRTDHFGRLTRRKLIDVDQFRSDLVDENSMCPLEQQHRRERSRQRVTHGLSRGVLELAVMKLTAAAATGDVFISTRIRCADELPTAAIRAFDGQIHDASPCRARDYASTTEPSGKRNYECALVR